MLQSLIYWIGIVIKYIKHFPKNKRGCSRSYPPTFPHTFMGVYRLIHEGHILQKEEKNVYKKFIQIIHIVIHIVEYYSERGACERKGNISYAWLRIMKR